jgi:cadmium resistance protein CadD (predicted permease)
MSFGLYALGYVIVIIAIVYIAHLMHIPQNWIFGIGLLMAGIGLVTAVQSTRRRDPN